MINMQRYVIKRLCINLIIKTILEVILSERKRIFDAIIFILPFLISLLYVGIVLTSECWWVIGDGDDYHQLYCGNGKHYRAIDFEFLLHIAGPFFLLVSFIFVPPSNLIRSFIRVALLLYPNSIIFLLFLFGLLSLFEYLGASL